MELVQINYYPVKSLSPVSVTSRSVDDFGLTGDRRWMLVDGEGKFITQRTHPQLAKVCVTDSEGFLEVTLPTDNSFRVASPGTGQAREVCVWGDSVPAVAAAPELSEALSDFLSMPCELVYMPESTFRQVDRAFFNADQRVSFADGFPFLLLSLESLADLNQRLEEPVGINRFRGNLIVQGTAPYEEDQWRRILIGNIEFSVVKPCSRCVMTTVNPKTGKKGREPLMTLAGYRKNEFGVCFGQNLVHLSGGELNVGDRIEVLE